MGKVQLLKMPLLPEMEMPSVSMFEPLGLSDEQLDRMQEIMDESPNFVKRMLAAKKQQREAVEKSGQWQPGPDSWRPGDGLPKDFKLERQEQRFPRKR